MLLLLGACIVLLLSLYAISCCNGFRMVNTRMTQFVTGCKEKNIEFDLPPRLEGLQVPIQVCVNYSSSVLPCTNNSGDYAVLYTGDRDEPLDGFSMFRSFLRSGPQCVLFDICDVQSQVTKHRTAARHLSVKVGKYDQASAEVTVTGVSAHWNEHLLPVWQQRLWPITVICADEWPCLVGPETATAGLTSQYLRAQHQILHQPYAESQAYSCDGDGRPARQAFVSTLIPKDNMRPACTYSGCSKHLFPRYTTARRTAALFKLFDKISLKAEASSNVKTDIKFKIPIDSLLPAPFQFLMELRICLAVKGRNIVHTSKSNQLKLIYGPAFFSAVGFHLDLYKERGCYTLRLWDDIRGMEGLDSLRSLEPLRQVVLSVGQFSGEGQVSAFVTGSSIFKRSGTEGNENITSATYPASILCWGTAPCASYAKVNAIDWMIELEHTTLYVDPKQDFVGRSSKQGRPLSISSPRHIHSLLCDGPNATDYYCSMRFVTGA